MPRSAGSLEEPAVGMQPCGAGVGPIARGDESGARRSSEPLGAGCGPWFCICDMDRDRLPLEPASATGRKPSRRDADLSLDLRRKATTPLMSLTFLAVLTIIVTTCLRASRGCSSKAAACMSGRMGFDFCGSPTFSGGSSSGLYVTGMSPPS